MAIPDWKGENHMGKVSKIIKYYDVHSGEGLYNAMHDKSVYEVEYPDVTMEKLLANTTQGPIWLIQFSQKQHPQFSGSQIHRFICT